MLSLARRALHSLRMESFQPDLSLVPVNLREKQACFVTLRKCEALRGCIGQVMARLPLYQAVLHNAQSAALCDPRFPAVQPDEVDQIRIEISVLSEPRALSFVSVDDLLDQLQPHHHGVLLELGGRMATFLPQVWEHIPERTEFLDRLAQKAGFPPSSWRGKNTLLSVYQVESFEEN